MNDNDIENDSLLENYQEDQEPAAYLGIGQVALLDSLSESAAKKARDQNSSKKQIKQSIRQAKQSFSRQHQSNSASTIFAIVNTMVGSVCLVLPQVFLKSGIISSLIVMLILGLVQYKTCSILVKHQREDEADIEDVIKRLLNKTWANVFRVISGSLVFIVGIVYFLLINSTLYPILTFIFTKVGFTKYAPLGSDPEYDQFSIQYLAIILFFPLTLTLFYKNIEGIIKLAHLGIVAILGYCIFIVYTFVLAVYNGEFQKDTNKIVYFTFNINQPAGQFALAFMVHNVIGAMMKNNKVKSNNQRDLGLAYLFAIIIYGCIGTFGALSISSKTAKNPSTILDFYSNGDIAVLIIESLFLVHLLTTFPIFNFISRHQILNAFYPQNSAPTVLFYGFSFLFIGICLLMQLFNVNPGLVIALDGSFCGFLIIYIIPIALHMNCYYGKPKKFKKTKITDNEEYENKVVSKDLLESAKSTTSLGGTKYICNEHEGYLSVNKNLRWFLYGLFICIGLFNFYLGIAEVLE